MIKPLQGHFTIWAPGPK